MGKNSTWPRITIITPSYNQGEFIEETIKSILSQNYPNLEYFVVDGGSTDNTVEIIQKYADKIDWWVSESDRGQSHAINKGLARATGEIINWINSDDLLFPGSLTRIAEAYLSQEGKVELITGAIARIDKEGRILRISSPPSFRAITAKNFMIPIGQQSSFFTRAAINLTGPLREDLHAIMDMDLYYRILTRGGNFIRVNALIGAIRNHEKAKGFAQRVLWDEERPVYLKKIGMSQAKKIKSLLKMRIIRSLDASYLRSFYLTKHYAGLSLTGNGLLEPKSL
jgi:glycosyltransferase involved in cell wall biosynthesis